MDEEEDERETLNRLAKPSNSNFRVLVTQHYVAFSALDFPLGVFSFLELISKLSLRERRYGQRQVHWTPLYHTLCACVCVLVVVIVLGWLG